MTEKEEKREITDSEHACVCMYWGRDSNYLFAFSLSLSRVFRGDSCSHSELHHSEKGDPHSSRHGQMEAFPGTQGVCTVELELGERLGFFLDRIF